VLVESGLDPDVEKKLKQKSISADFVAKSLREAAEWIISAMV
jgi:hypothetical protein